jgi:hypothetical protein
VSIVSPGQAGHVRIHLLDERVPKAALQGFRPIKRHPEGRATGAALLTRMGRFHHSRILPYSPIALDSHGIYPINSTTDQQLVLE